MSGTSSVVVKRINDIEHRVVFVHCMTHSLVLKILKSTNICQSYSKNKSGTVFLTHSVYISSKTGFMV